MSRTSHPCERGHDALEARARRRSSRRGQIGNAQEIRIVSERWFSDELQALVLTRHNDPRSGETVYRLRNILRAEPDPNLFTVPADYIVQERGIRQRQQ